MNFQKYTDKFIAGTLLPFMPRSVSPNQVTWLRIISLPFIFYLLVKENYLSGLILFSISALTDALDGAMARTRNQITELGKILDAVADKGLIFLVAFIFIPRYFGWTLLVLLILLEALNAAMAYWSKRKIRINPGANWAGKIKMIIQCAAFIMIFIGLFSPSDFWLKYAYLLLWLSLFFTLLQAFLYPRTRQQSRHA